MKKLSISLLVMLLIASLFTSCSMGSDDASDVRVKVRLTPSGGGRSLTTDFETINLDDDNITWHYSAAKVSETQFNYGATSDSLLPKDGIVTLSQGEWKIKLWAYKDSKKVYDSDESNVTIKWNFYEPNVTVQVPVKQNTGDNGFIVINNVTIPNGNSNVSPNYISIDNTIITNFPEPYMRLECAPGSHTITFEYRSDENTVVPSKSVVVNVISGRETTISGDITKEELSTGGSAEVQAIEVKKDSKVEVITSVAPAQPSSSTEPQNKTTVTFPAGSFNADSANAVLNLSVKSAGEITVTSTEVPAVAGIDISLLVNNQPVTEFNGKEVVIETYIAKDLTNVSVKYNGAGDQPIATDDDTVADKTVAAELDSSSLATALGYNKETGLLRFKTNHFSEYYVLADVEALNVSTGILYKELTTAIKEANSGDQLSLKNNVCMGERITIKNKSLTIDLAGKTISVKKGYNESAGLFLIDNDGKLTINDSSDGKTGTVDAYNGSEINEETGRGTVLCAICIYPDNGYKAELTINGGKFIGSSYAISGNGVDTTEDSTQITINNGTFEAKGVAIYHPQNGNLSINGGELRGDDSAIEIRAGNLYINGGSFAATAQSFTCNPNGNGTTTSGAAIAIAQHTTKKDIAVMINGGTFTGIRALNESNPQANDPAPRVSLGVTDGIFNGEVSADDASGFIFGGKFSTNPSAYVALGYNAKLDSGKYVVSSTSDIIIKSANQLMQFAASVNAGNDYAGETIALGNDIDLTGITWIPIGNAEKPFKGTFNGVNHKISNLTITSTSDYVGLFGFLDGGIVENIEIQSVSITNTSDDTGAAVGRIINGGKVSNVKVLSGSITGNKRTGGVVGTIKAYGTIENCTNAASVTSNTYNAGGIAGAAYYTESGKEMYITSCENTGAVVSNGNCAGGIVGLSAANVSGCNNTAEITGSGTSIGGIVGEQKTYGSVTNNTNTGSVENTNNGNYGNGGIIGWLRYHGTSEASSYAVSDIISVTGNTNRGNVLGGNDAGGIVGTVYNSAVVTGNTNEATSLSGTTFAAGIVGNYQTTETPAAPEPKSNKLTFAGNTNTTSIDNIEATNKNSLIYTNGNPIITPLAYMDNFSFCEIDSNGTQVGDPIYTTDFSNDVAEKFCPSGHSGTTEDSNSHENFVPSFVVRNGVAEIYRNSAWKQFDNIESSKTYEIRYDLKINELYNRKTSYGLNKALGFDFGESNLWESRKLLFAKDGNELKVYFNSFDDPHATTIEAGKVYTITITFSQSIDTTNNYKLTVNVKVIDPETNREAFGPVEFTRTRNNDPFDSYYWDIYYPAN